MKTTLELFSPMIITSRLMPGIRVGNSYISIDTETGSVWIDTPEFSYEINDIRAGGRMAGDTPETVLASILYAACSFLAACAESRQYGARRYNDPMRGENSNIFPPHVGEWAEMYSDELSMASFDLCEAITANCSEN